MLLAEPFVAICSKDKIKSMKALWLIVILSISTLAQAKSEQEKKREPIPALALVTYFDVENGEVYNWWAEQASGDLSKISRVTNLWLEQAIDNFTFVNPSKEKVEVPERLRLTNLPLTQLVELAKMYQAKVLVHGDVRFKRSPLLSEGVRVQVNLKAYHAFNGQNIGEILRISDVSTQKIERISQKMDNVVIDGFKELAQDMEDAHKKGAGQSLVLLVSGELNQSQLERLKRQIKTTIPEVADIVESGFDMGLVKLKINYMGAGTEDFQRSLQALRSKDFLTQVVTAKAGEIQLDVKPF